MNYEIKGQKDECMDRCKERRLFHSCLCATCAQSREPERALDPLGQELHTVVSHHVGSGTGTQVFWKSS